MVRFLMVGLEGKCGWGGVVGLLCVLGEGVWCAEEIVADY